jgi:thiamine biosynthesis lipoprotein
MKIQTSESFQTCHFEAMSCPCEILLHSEDSTLFERATNIVQSEVRRIELKYSRFLQGNITDRINHSQDREVQVDDETSDLLDFADECYEMSEGLFDITRHGWDRIEWERPCLRLPRGFSIDFGGICKEYAADRALGLIRDITDASALVNLGGDIAVAGDRVWSVGIEDPSRPGQIAHTVHLSRGGVATSGTTKRPGHIVNPKTGCAVLGSPLSVTVAARTCTEAGFWSTLAILKREEAESFLKDQFLEFWCYRSF